VNDHCHRARPLRATSLFGVLLAVFVVPMSVAGSAVTLPSVATALAGNAAQLQWVVNAFNVMFAVTTVVWGRVADRHGHRLVLRVGAATVIVGSALSASATNLLVLDLARGVVGAGAAALLTASTGLISVTLQRAPRARAFAMFGVVMGFGLALGPTFAGLAVDQVGWRALFAAIGAVVLVGVVVSGRLPATPSGISQHEAAQPVPLLRNRKFITVCLIPILHAVGFIAVLTYLPLVLRAAWGMSAGEAGTAMLLMTGPVLLASPFGSLLLRHPRWTFGRVVTIALICLLTGDVLLLAAGLASPVPLIAGMVLVGIAFGLPLGLLDGAALSAAPANASGRAAGVFNLIRLGAEALAVALLGAALSAVLTAQGDADSAHAALAGAAGSAARLIDAFFYVQIGVAVLVVAGTAAFLVLQRRNVTREQATSAAKTTPEAIDIPSTV
jgi:predicted MFS family arabinose efflux permease